METYNKQNKIQKEIMRLISIFRIDWNQVHKAEKCGIEVYDFSPTKKEKVGATLIVSSLVIPVVLPAPIVIPLSRMFLLGGRR